MGLEIMLVAVALGMDSFSLSLGLGCQKVERKTIWGFTFLVGLFHVLMPLLGFFLGRAAGLFLGEIAAYIGAAVLFFLGVKMLREAIKGNKKDDCILEGWVLLVLPLSVSIDALSVGFGIGTFGINSFAAAVLFGLTAALLTRLGFMLGDRAGHLIKNSEYLAGFIFIGLAITAFL